MRSAPIRYLLAAFVSLFLTSGCLRASQQVKAAQVFTAAGSATTPENLQQRGVRRLRAVSINLELFDERAAQSFIQRKREQGDVAQATEMNFFPDVSIAVNWNGAESVQQPAGFVWTGTVVGSSAGRALMAVSGKNVTATVTRGDGLIYEIRTTADGMWWVREVDQKEFPQESAPVAPDRK